ncbi:MarR family winged helix-turn-helix transcriptional regulator [Demequina soli]|uniref:MarR family winged helix-turn-helix transcriptional regulator n=1 Tax=Demequina soli TaxID=1638987 RepID=UPI0007842018|nr:MarR family transcriptional regulator [Demequina soli]
MTDNASTELRQAVVRLYSRFRSERAEGEVPDAALLVLLALDKKDQMSLSDLADSARVTLGSMSQTVRRLEQLAYVAKSRSEHDRRKVVFALTREGRAAAAASRKHRRDWLDTKLADLTPTERADIARAAPILLRIANS